MEILKTLVATVLPIIIGFSFVKMFDLQMKQVFPSAIGYLFVLTIVAFNLYISISFLDGFILIGQRGVVIYNFILIASIVISIFIVKNANEAKNDSE